MASEVRITCSLQVQKGNLLYQGQPTAFLANMAGTKGPAPGAFAASVSGTDVDLSQFTQAGVCRIMNLDSTNYATLGIHDGVVFHPVAELLPGETYILRLSRWLGKELSLVGTGTSGSVVHTLRVIADTADCPFLVEAFET